MFSLLSLADELLLGIIDQIDNKLDLSNICLTCSRFQGLAEPFLYRDVLVRTGKQAVNLSHSLRKRTERASSIRSLQIRYLQDDVAGIAVLNPDLRMMSRLREFTVESPCCNDKGAIDNPEWIWERQIDETDFCKYASSMTLTPEPRVQIPLMTFTLHSHGDQNNKFNLGRRSVILLHPTLQNLTLSCFDIGDDLETFLGKKPRSTSLRTLVFDECNIKSSGLRAVLSVPRRLERLVLGERKHHVDDDERHSNLLSNVDALIGALCLQSESLLYLKHTGGALALRHYSQSVEHISLDFLTELRELEVDEQSWWRLILQMLSPQGGLPPQLQRLRIYAPRRWGVEFNLSFLTSAPSWLRKAAQFEYVLDHYRDPAIDPAGIIEELWTEAHMNEVYDVQKKLKGHGVHQLRVLILYGWSYIPPYMFGETLPTEHVAYDSTSPLVFGTYKLKRPEKELRAAAG
ncbi:hypothetical protein EJ08DRAFT_701153 [Tothia fuscella]|uniref:F-box domain-containing protein n=1 Tax=Tothia fuscella TaxID=1048955 RepID=A0A9P4TUH9_9PEZI|nr:hypothetical protein EJ08DRAFT_701153 [Tothia fuscella]